MPYPQATDDPRSRRWDWGPELMTCGPYRPISLITYTTRISSIFPQATVRRDSDGTFHPALSLDLTFAGKVNRVSAIRCVLRVAGSSEVIFDEFVRLVSDVRDRSDDRNSDLLVQQVMNWDLTGKVQLWWPTGYGEQALYD